MIFLINGIKHRKNEKSEEGENSQKTWEVDEVKFYPFETYSLFLPVKTITR